MRRGRHFVALLRRPAERQGRQADRLYTSSRLAGYRYRADFVDAAMLQILPFEAIDTGLRSTFDFRRKAIHRLIHLGYQDVQEAFDEAQELWERLVLIHAQGRMNVASADALPRRTRREPCPGTSHTNLGWKPRGMQTFNRQFHAY